MTASAAMPSGDPLLRVVKLAHRFKARTVLDGLSLDVRTGECFGLLGPNGSGKSTALALVAGLLPLQVGAVEFDGHSAAVSGRALRESSGVVFQNPSLDPKLTVRQNLALAARLRSIPADEAKQRIAQQLALAGLDDRAKDPVKTLSGGMRRRLDIARALIHGPRILLLDEPTAGLDEVAFRQTWERLALMRKRTRLTLLLATHRPEEAERCDRLAIINHGRIVAIDTPEGLKRRVAHDAVILEPQDPAAVTDLRADVERRFGLPCLVDDGRVLVECERGHEWVPRLVEAYPDGHLATVSLRHPTLADVFLKVTGESLSAVDAQAA